MADNQLMTCSRMYNSKILAKFLNSLWGLVLFSGALFFNSALLAQNIDIRDDAPSRYVVVKGDTLWDISGRFLEDPWRWPEVWQINPQIENPHLIYPGDEIELRYRDGSPVLTLNRGGEIYATGLPIKKVSPEVRKEQILSPIPAIPLDKISAFIRQSNVVTDQELAAMPAILETRSGTLLSADRDVVFARGQWTAGVNTYDIIRPGRDYIDPVSGKKLGKEAIFIGTGTIINLDKDQATLQLDETTREVRRDDRFMVRESKVIDANYFPVPPQFDVEGSIVDINSGKTMGGQYDTIVINKGSQQGLEVGHLLTIQKPDINVEDPNAKGDLAKRFSRALRMEQDHIASFEGEKFASVLVYRAFEESSMAIILSTKRPVRLNDKIITP